MKKYVDFSSPEACELQSYVNPRIQILGTLFDRADKMSFTKQFPPKRRTVKAYHKSLQRYLKQEQREKARSFGMSLPEYERLQLKAEAILERFDTGHSMGCTKSIMVNGKLFCTVDNTQEYARSCTWRATHGHFKIKLSRAALRGLTLDGWTWKYGALSLQESGYKSTYKVELK